MANGGASPQPTRLTDRDKSFLTVLYEIGGVLAARQVHQHFYQGTTEGTFDNRLRRLRDNDFVRYPTREQVRLHPVPEKVVWLGLRGIREIAADYGIEVDLSRVKSRTSEKNLSKVLRREGIHWRREPRWGLLKHDIQVADVYFAARAGAEKVGLDWVGWTPEWQFRAEPGLQRFSYTATRQRQDGSREEVEETAAVYPDGLLVVSRPTGHQGEVEMLVYLVELDRGSERGRRFEDEKIIQAQAYLMSSVYTQRTGLTRGRVIFITTGPERRDNLKRRAEAISRKRSHYFSAIDELNPDSFFSEPVWYQLGRREPVPLLHPAK